MGLISRLVGKLFGSAGTEGATELVATICVSVNGMMGRQKREEAEIAKESDPKVKAWKQKWLKEYLKEQQDIINDALNQASIDELRIAAKLISTSFPYPDEPEYQRGVATLIDAAIRRR